jgi:hypothetical protein
MKQYLIWAVLILAAIIGISNSYIQPKTEKKENEVGRYQIIYANDNIYRLDSVSGHAWIFGKDGLIPTWILIR